ncbi:septation protein SepH [Demequina sp.]|uniref:septation protein SepH n=1 Tax=Demequina sp. TaxID=2050685 RepID=UPI003D10511B
MTRVNLVGPAEDGLHIVVETDGGEQYTLAITDELRHAVRYARPKPAYDAADDSSDQLSPKEIQQRIRAGLTAAELSELTGAPLETLEKFEPPVIAERTYVAELARTTRIGRDPSAPVLGELVIDRLAGRGVDPDDVLWDAWREVDEPWQVAVDFPAGGRTVRAQWTFDHSSRTLTAEDDEARWLTETELLDVPIPRRHLAAVPQSADDSAPLPEHRPAMPVSAEPEPEPEEIVDEVDPTEALLDDLDARRGSREAPADVEDDDSDDELFEGFGPANQRTAEVGFGQSMPHPAGSALRGEPEAKAEEASDNPPTEELEKPTRKGRASVPSWDEIVFGARHDQG